MASLSRVENQHTGFFRQLYLKLDPEADSSFIPNAEDDERMDAFREWLRAVPNKGEIAEECADLTEAEQEAEIQRLEAILAQEHRSKETWLSTTGDKAATICKYLMLIAIQTSPIVADVTSVVFLKDPTLGTVSALVMAGWSYAVTNIFFTEPRF